MKRKDLVEYESRELSFIAGHSADVTKRGHPITAKDLYPDLNWPTSIAFGRGSVPLSLVLLLHQKVALYVPPTSRRMLGARWQMPVEAVFELCRAGMIQPLIGHPPDYAARHFDHLMNLNPPSVWARGLGLLRALGMEEKLEEAKVELPLDKIASLGWVRRRWERHFPDANATELTKQIKREISTQYADLWVFGLGEVAATLKQHGTPSRIARALQLVNEIRTYPTIFGLGGTAHYGLESLQSEPSLLDTSTGERSNARVIPPELKMILCDGVGIDLRNLQAEDIIEFHASGYARDLQEALTAFNEQAGMLIVPDHPVNTEAVFNAAARLQNSLKEALQLLSDPGFRRSARNTRRRINWLFRAGGLAVGAWIGNILGANWIGMMGAAGFSAALMQQLMPEGWKDRAVFSSIADQVSPAIAHLWKIAESRHTSQR